MTDLNPDFGDAEPEDSWDPDDPVPVLLVNLLRRARLLAAHDDPVEHRVLDVLVEVVARARTRELSPRELMRARDLDTDIAHVRGRL